jgi:hypothetical protein
MTQDMKILPPPENPAAMTSIQGLKPSLKLQEYVWRWNQAAIRTGSPLRIAIHIVKSPASTVTQLTLTNPTRAPDNGMPPPRRVTYSLALPSMGAPPHGPARALQEATATPRGASGLAEDVLSVGGTVQLDAPPPPPTKAVTDLDVVKAAVAALLQHEGQTVSFDVKVGSQR